MDVDDKSLEGKRVLVRVDFNVSVSNGSVLAVAADSTCDVGLVGYEMTLLVSRTENALTPQLITEMRQNLPTDGLRRS